MKISDRLYAASAILKARLFGIKTPLAVSCELTNRCNLRCEYCGTWEKDENEQSTHEIIKKLEIFRKMGTKWLSFTGGEALLRDDIGELVQSGREKGFYVSLSSNGKLVEKKIDQLKLLNRIKFSLDGPSEVHDIQRGKGSFDAVIRAIEVCQNNNINFRLECVLTKYNLDTTDYLLKFASDVSTKITFQPAIQKMLFADKPNPIKPATDTYRKTISKLITQKKLGAPISNSLAGLKHLYYWPEPKKIHCTAGILTCDMLSDGSLNPCVRIEKGGSTNKNIKQGFESMTNYPECKQCWCSSLVDFNLIASLNIPTILEYLETY